MRYAILGIGVLLIISGCGLVQSADTKATDVKATIGSPSDVDRCFYFTRRAYPDAHFQLTSQQVSTSMNAEIVDIQATRNDVKPLYEVAVQCRFNREILVDFHWTNGPLP